MFSFVEELFKNASKGIRSALDELLDDKSLLEDIKSDSGEYSSEVNQICSSLETITTDIDALEKNVQKAEVNMGIVNDSEITGDIFGTTLAIDGLSMGGGFNQSSNVETDIENIKNTMTQEEFFDLIDNSILSNEDKEKAKQLYLAGNIRSAIALFLSVDCQNQIDSKKDDLEKKRKEVQEKKYDDPEYAYYEHLSSILLSRESDIEEYERLKEKFDKYDEPIRTLENEIYVLQQRKYAIDVAIKEWSFDYLDNLKDSEEFKNAVNSDDETISYIVERLEDIYSHQGNVSIHDFNMICQGGLINGEEINSNNINMMALFSSMKNSDVLKDYFSSDMTEEDFSEKWLLTTNVNTKKSLESRAMIYLTDEEIEKYNYLYYAEGSDRAYEYLLAKEDSINCMQGFEKAVDTIKDIDSGNSQVSRVFIAFKEGGMSGVVKWFNDMATTFNGNTTMTSQEYADMFIAQTLLSQINVASVSKEELEQYFATGQIDYSVYQKLKSKSNVIQADIYYEMGQISKEEYDAWINLSNDENYKSLTNKIGNSKILGVGEGKVLSTFYNAGSSVGYMAPSIALSVVGSGGGATPLLGRILSSASMFGASYGGSYKQGISSGAGEFNACLFALLSAGSEVTLELALGGIKGIALGDEFIDTAVDISKTANYWQIFKNSLIDTVGSIGSEIKEESIQLIFGKFVESGFLNKPLDFTDLDKELLETAITTVISTFAMNAPSNVINLGMQTNQYILDNTRTISFKIRDDKYINYTQAQLAGFIDSEGNVDQNALQSDIENRFKNNEFETSTNMTPNSSSIETLSENQDNIDEEVVLRSNGYWQPKPFNPDSSVSNLTAAALKLDALYGVGQGRNYIDDYCYSKDINVVPEGPARDIIEGTSWDDIIEYLIETDQDIIRSPKNYIPTLSNGEKNIDADIQKTLMSAIEAMDKKYGIGEGIKALTEVAKTGNLNLITRNNNARASLFSIPLNIIGSFVNSYQNANNSNNVQTEINQNPKVEPVDSLKVETSKDEFVSPIEEIIDPIIDLESNSNTPNIPNMIDGVMEKVQDAKTKVEQAIDNIKSKMSQQTSVEIAPKPKISPEDIVKTPNGLKEMLNNSISNWESRMDLDTYNKIKEQYELYENLDRRTDFLAEKARNRNSVVDYSGDWQRTLGRRNESSRYLNALIAAAKTTIETEQKATNLETSPQTETNFEFVNPVEEITDPEIDLDTPVNTPNIPNMIDGVMGKIQDIKAKTEQTIDKIQTKILEQTSTPAKPKISPEDIAKTPNGLKEMLNNSISNWESRMDVDTYNKIKEQYKLYEDLDRRTDFLGEKVRNRNSVVDYSGDWQRTLGRRNESSRYLNALIADAKTTIETEQKATNLETSPQTEPNFEFVNPVEEIIDPVIDLDTPVNTPNIPNMIDGVMEKIQDAKTKAEGAIDNIKTKMSQQIANDLEVNKEEILMPYIEDEIDEVLPVDSIIERLNNIDVEAEIEGLDDYNSGIEVNYAPLETMNSEIVNESKETNIQSDNIVNLWETKNSEFYVFLDNIQDVIEAIKNGNLKLSDIKDSFKPGDDIQNILEKNYSEKGIILNYTDEAHSVAISSNPFLPSVINPNFFEQYKNEIIEAYREMVLTTDNISIEIPSVVFTNNLFEKLLTKPDKIYTFVDINLTGEQIAKLKSNFIYAYLINDGERIKISSQYAFKFYTPNQLENTNDLSIDFEQLQTENFENLTFLPDEATISFKNPVSDRRYKICTFSEEVVFAAIKEKLDLLDKLNKPFTINLTVEKRSAFNKVFADTKYENLQITIENDYYQYSLDEYLKEEEILNALVEPIKNANLSPLERYLAVYNIVKNFKPYKENKNDPSQSRNLRYILNNDYMVCVGYANLLAELMDKVDLDGFKTSVSIDTSYDKGFTLEEKSVSNDGHARTIISIDDAKYNIHGLYIADPTWDNSLNNNFLNHALMPYDKMQTEYRMFWYGFHDVILDVHNFQEYNDQVNFLLKREIKNQQQNKYSNKTFNDVLMNSYRNVCLKIVNSMYSDPKFQNYNNLLSNCKTESDYESLLTDIGNYLLTRINQPISDDVILDASMESMRKTRSYLGDDILQEVEDKTRKKHSTMEGLNFPYEISSENDFKLNKKGDSSEVIKKTTTNENSVNRNTEDSLTTNDILNAQSIINAVKTSILPTLDTSVKNLLEIGKGSKQINNVFRNSQNSDSKNLHSEVLHIFELLNNLKNSVQYTPELQTKLNELLDYVESIQGEFTTFSNDQKIVELEQELYQKLDQLQYKLSMELYDFNEGDTNPKHSIKDLEDTRHYIEEEQRKIRNSLADFRENIYYKIRQESFGLNGMIDSLEWIYSSIYGLRDGNLLERNMMDYYEYNGLVNQMRNLLDVLKDIKRDSYIHDYYYIDSRMVDAAAKNSVFDIVRKILGNFEELDDTLRHEVRIEFEKIDDQIEGIKKESKNKQESFDEKGRILSNLVEIKMNLADLNNDTNIFLNTKDIANSMSQEINKIEEQINIIQQIDLNLESIKVISELIQIIKSELKTSRGNVLDVQKVKDLYDKLVSNLEEISKELDLKHESNLSVSNEHDNFMLEFLDELDSSDEQKVISEESNDNDVTPLEDISNQADSFVPVNIKEYVQTGLENGSLVPKEASKFARIFARQGKVGEQVVTYSDNGIVETTNDVSIDETTGEPGWIVTKALNGEAVVDKFGNKNEWIIPDSTFKKKYEIDPENSGLFKPKGEPQMFVQIQDNIKFNAPWGEEMNISRGGYLNVTNLDDIYGIQERDFNDTYRFSEPEVLNLDNIQNKEEVFVPTKEDVIDEVLPVDPIDERLNSIEIQAKLEGIEDYNSGMENEKQPEDYIFKYLTDKEKIKFQDFDKLEFKDKVGLIISLKSEKAQLLALKFFDDEFEKAKIVYRFSSDNLKIEGLKWLEKDSYKRQIIQKLSSEQDKINCLKYLSDDYCKSEIIETLSSEQDKINCLKYLSDDYCKSEIIETLSAEQDKINCLKYLSYDYCKSKIIKTLSSEQDKINCLKYLSDDYCKSEIIETLSSDQLKIDCLKYLTSDYNKADIIKTLSSDQLKIDCLKYLTSDYNKEGIIKTLSNEFIYYGLKQLESSTLIIENLSLLQDINQKINLILELDTINNKLSGIKTLSDELKVEALKKMNDKTLKINTICLINDISLKLEQLSGLSLEEKVIVLSSIQDDTVRISELQKLNISLEQIGEILMTAINDRTLRYNSNLFYLVKDIILENLSKTQTFFKQFSSLDDGYYGADQNATRKYVRYEILNHKFISENTDDLKKYLQEELKTTPDEINSFISRISNPSLTSSITFAQFELISDYVFQSVNEDIDAHYEIMSKNFRRSTNVEYDRLQKMLVDRGLTQLEATKVLDCIDTTGICSYASVANLIFAKYYNNPLAFEKDFGYSMYVDIDGFKRLNSSELLLDMYTFVNSDKVYDNNFFVIDDGGKISISEKFSNTSTIDTENQVYLAGGWGVSIDAINEFLKSKNPNINMKQIKKINDSLNYKEEFIEMITSILEDDKQVILGISSDRTGQHEIRFILNSKEKHKVVSTKNWGEGGGHAVYLTGINKDFAVVSSWGCEYLIPLEDFMNGNFVINVIDLEVN